MPLFAPPEIPASLCSTIDFAEMRPAERALARAEVHARVESGQLPEKLVPLACSKGKFRLGRFVDEAGNVYRLGDVVYVLNEAPETRDDLRLYRRARTREILTATFAAASSPVVFVSPVYLPVWMGAGVVATNSNGAAREALARAVSAYDTAMFVDNAAREYAVLPSTVPTALARTTELVEEARGCMVGHTDPRFLADAAIVEEYGRAGYDAGRLLQAAEAGPAEAGCDLRAAIAGGLTIAPPLATADDSTDPL